MVLLEIACFNPDSAIVADAAGAGRIELCSGQHLGGTTPPLDWITFVMTKVKIPVFVMIRPRGGDFCYTPAEFEHMKTQIDEFRAHAAGLVFGILDNEKRVDIDRTRELVRRAHPLPCTFHRAFDETPNPEQALEHIVAAGCQALLTSGGASSATGGLDMLQTLVQRAEGRIAVIAGGGVRASNLARIRDETGATTFHSSALPARVTVPDATEIERMTQILQE